MVDGISGKNRSLELYDKSGDIMNYSEPEYTDIKLLEQDEPDVKYKQKKNLEERVKYKFWGGGKRKKAHCRVMLTKGKG